MASNSNTIADENGDYSDWIEIFNGSAKRINLAGWSLTDKTDNHRLWIFPDITLSSNEYLIVFASGKDRTDPDGELHTNFRLNRDGEYFALFKNDGEPATVFDPSYPEQIADISYAYFDGEFLFTKAPTPGAENILEGPQPISEPSFSSGRGFYNSPFQLDVITDEPGAHIIYTLDGSEPDLDNGIIYSEPLEISTTTVLRAVSMRGKAKSAAVTSTYLFLDDVINQPNNPSGYPDEWGPFLVLKGNAPAYYEMDTKITQDSRWEHLMKESLLSIPVISIVTDKDNFFSRSTDPDTGGIYIYTGAPGFGNVPLMGNGWERPVSIEFFDKEGINEFQIDCGLRLHGGHSRRAEKSPKHSFRLHFRNMYGNSRLEYPLFGDDAADSFNRIVLRSTFGNSWIHWRSSERLRHQMIRDLWAKDTQHAMGHPSGSGIYVHLYINGLYWGIYNPTERIDDSFCADYFGGYREDWDVIKDFSDVARGDIFAWNTMMNMAESGMEDNENYFRLQGKNPDGTNNPSYPAYLDMGNFIDYMILNFYGANWDWDTHNWVAVRNRVNPGKGFIFLCWDSEHILRDLHESSIDLNNENRPSGLFNQLWKSAEFRRLFADRVQMHCFNSGVLSPEFASERWMIRSDQIETAMIAESARWGDYRRAAHQWSTGPYVSYTMDHWYSHQDYIINTYFPERTNVFIEQLRDADFFPIIDAPEFRINDDEVKDSPAYEEDVLSILPEKGDIYYTIDGSDPLDIDGLPGSSAILYEDEIILTNSIYIKARRKMNGISSALSEMHLAVIRESADITELDPEPFKISESEYIFNFWPSDAPEFSYPENMKFWQSDVTDPKIDCPLEYLYHIPYDDYSPDDFSTKGFPYNNTRRTRINGLNDEGISFINTGRERDLGAAVLALDTKNAEKLYVSFLAGTVKPNSSVYGIRLQYRVGNNGDFIDVENEYGQAVEYTRNENSGHVQHFGPVELPSDLLNEPYVQLLWRYYHISGTSGPRAELRLDNIAIQTDEHVSVRDDNAACNSETIILHQNYPNPFNSETAIYYELPKAEHVCIHIYDISGRLVRTLVDSRENGGLHTVFWDGNDYSGSDVVSGVYLLHMQIANQSKIVKMLKIK